MKFLPLVVLLTLSSLWLAFELNSKDPAVMFLKSLDKDQRETAVFEVDNSTREFWSYLPGAMMPRAGIKFSEMSDDQKKLALTLLESSLSAKGFSKVERIIMLEGVLAEIDNNPEFRDPEKYSIAFYGNPEKDKIWGWSFEGHHLSLNFTNVNGKLAVAPRFFGASPATILSGPHKGKRTLGAESDLGLDLIESMDESQLLSTRFHNEVYLDIVSGNAMELSPLDPVGIAYTELSDSQKSILKSLINEYASALPKTVADQRMKQIREEGMHNIHFGWAGPARRGSAHYYRIQGKSFLIEFDHTFNDNNHIHTVWRDFQGDFCRDLIREHYAQIDHH